MSRKKYTYSDVTLYIKQLGYTLIDNNYVNYHAKMALVDSNGYYYFSCLAKLKAGNAPSMVHILNPYTIKNIQLWCQLNNKPFQLVSENYEGTNKKLNWQCLNSGCREIFQMRWHNISQGQKCPYCSGQNVGMSNCLAVVNPLLSNQWHPTKNDGLTPNDVTEFSGQKVWWQCDKNPKHEWQSTVACRNKCGCPYCAGLFPSADYNLLVHNPMLCEEWDYNKNEQKPSEYTPHSHYKVWWKCKECGHEWCASIANRNRGNGCPVCKISKGEKLISQLLDMHNIFYIAQITFDDLRGIGGRLLSYDFYVPTLNLLIEYQGLQHEHYCEGFHKSKNAFKKQHEHDLRKREYAKNNDIELLEIWYWNFNNIEEILHQALTI